MTRTIHRRFVVDRQRRLSIGSAVEQTIDIVGRFQLDAVDRENVIADVYGRAGNSER